MKKVFILTLLIAAHAASSSLAVPCEPCTSWGAVKWCYSNNPNPPECCTCEKPAIMAAGVISRNRAAEYLADCQSVSIFAEDGALVQTGSLQSVLRLRLRPGRYCFVGEDPMSEVTALLRVVIFA
jgi:hypothetical protein